MSISSSKGNVSRYRIELKTTQDDLSNVVPDFAVETTSGSPAAATEQDGTNSTHF